MLTLEMVSCRIGEEGLIAVNGRGRRPNTWRQKRALPRRGSVVIGVKADERVELKTNVRAIEKGDSLS